MAKADMFLKVEGARTGAVKGEVTAPEHVDEIDIFDWHWGMSSPNALGGTGAAGKSALSEISFSKQTDRATTSLMSVLRNNELIKKAVLTVCKAGTSPPVPYLVITVENARLTAHSIGTAEPGKPTLIEKLSMAFEKIKVDYAPQLNSGSKGAQQSFSASVKE